MPHFVLLRKQRAVGHGFFHEGVLRVVTGHAFRWIYDCGGGKNTKDEVGAYLAETKGAPVDALFVSHLHRDHVSGLPTLLQGTRVRRAFIPHVSRTERMLVAIQCAAEAALPLWFARFLADPAGWLREHGVDEVYEVIHGREPAPDPRGPDGGNDDPGVKVTILERGVAVPAGTQHVTDNAQVVMELDTLAINFLFYVQPARLDQIEAFLSAFRKLALSPLELLKDKDEQRNLKHAYQAGWPDINWTSLCVACLPVGRPAFRGRPWFGGRHYPGPSWRHPLQRPAWLGLGDAVLKEPSEVAELKNHFKGSLRQVGVYSIPHHGSDDNFCDDVMYLCCDAADSDVREVFRYATAKKENAKHPSPSVRRTFEEHAIPLVVVSDDPETAFSLGLVFEK